MRSHPKYGKGPLRDQAGANETRSLSQQGGSIADPESLPKEIAGIGGRECFSRPNTAEEPIIRAFTARKEE